MLLPSYDNEKVRGEINLFAVPYVAAMSKNLIPSGNIHFKSDVQMFWINIHHLSCAEDKNKITNKRKTALFKV